MIKRTTALVIALLLCLGAFFCGCSPTYEQSPDKYEGIRWITYDYSFCINPADDCKGYYKFGDKKYNIQVSFESSRFTSVDTDNSGEELFYGDWLYEKDGKGNDQLYMYNIKFNSDDYEELKTNYAEFVTLKQEKI